MCCGSCVECYYYEHLECRTRRGGTVTTSFAQCNAGCLVCICVISGLIAYFAYQSWQKYENATQDYCTYTAGLSYAETCEIRSGYSGSREMYAYNTTHCGIMYSESTCNAGDDPTVTPQKSATCYIFSCDSFDDVSWSSPERDLSMFVYSVLCGAISFIFCLLICVGYCFCWRSYKEKQGYSDSAAPKDMNHNLRQIQMAEANSIFHANTND